MAMHPLAPYGHKLFASAETKFYCGQESKSFKIGGFDVVCRIEPENEFCDRPVKIICGRDQNSLEAEMITHFIGSTIESLTTSAHARQARNEITIENSHPQPKPCSPDASFEGICRFLDEVSKELSQRISKHELRLKLDELTEKYLQGIEIDRGAGLS